MSVAAVFECVTGVEVDGKEVWKNTEKKHQPLLLVNATDGTPLVAVAWESSEPVYSVQREEKLSQFIFDIADKEQLVCRALVTNLTEDQTFVFSLRRVGEHADTNKVNVLGPNATVRIESDAAHDECEMLLKKLVSGATGVAITVKEAERENKNTNFTLDIYPTSSVSSLKDAIWTTRDFYLKPKNEYELSPFCCMVMRPESSPSFGVSSSPRATPLGYSSASGQGMSPASPVSYASYIPESATFAAGAPGFPDESPPPQTRERDRDLDRREKKKREREVAEEHFAASLSHSDRRVHVKTTEVSLDVHYDKRAPQLTMCLSILNPDFFHVISAPEEEINYAELFGLTPKKVFREETCVLCLSAPPDIIYARCGHECACKTCDTVTKCPMCRGAIVAKIINKK
jgi:hypothetical protein